MALIIRLSACASTWVTVQRFSHHPVSSCHNLPASHHLQPCGALKRLLSLCCLVPPSVVQGLASTLSPPQPKWCPSSTAKGLKPLDVISVEQKLLVTITARVLASKRSWIPQDLLYFIADFWHHPTHPQTGNPETNWWPWLWKQRLKSQWLHPSLYTVSGSNVTKDTVTIELVCLLRVTHTHVGHIRCPWPETLQCEWVPFTQECRGNAESEHHLWTWWINL